MPSLAVEPIAAPNLLAPPDRQDPMRSQGWSTPGDDRATLTQSPHYRLDRAVTAASGQRARLSIPVGNATLFAIAGRLGRLTQSGPPDLQPVALGRKSEGSKVYGLGAERRIGPVEVSATYQYSKLNADQPQPDSDFRIEGGRSHSLRATAKIRFRH